MRNHNTPCAVRNSFWRAALAFLALPGLVAFLVPVLIGLGTEKPFASTATPILGIGSGLLLWCVVNFYIVGKGTLAPWSPPVILVTKGPYRFSRNPMYLAVLTIVWGWALGFRSTAISIYAVLLMVGFHLRIVLGEEPWLADRYGEAWKRYRASEPRWIGRI